MFVGGIRNRINARKQEEFMFNYCAKEQLARNNLILKQGLSRIEGKFYLVYSSKLWFQVLNPNLNW